MGTHGKLNVSDREKQYKRKIKLWKIGKNTKREEYHYMQIIQAIRLLQGKRTQFILRGRLVPPTKIVQFVKRDRRALKKEDLLCSQFGKDVVDHERMIQRLTHFQYQLHQTFRTRLRQKAWLVQDVTTRTTRNRQQHTGNRPREEEHQRILRFNLYCHPKSRQERISYETIRRLGLRKQ